MRTTDFEKLIPIYGVFDDVAVSKTGVYTIGYELDLPVAYTMTEEDYDAQCQKFFDAIQTLQPRTIIHKQDIFTKKKYQPELTGQEIHDDVQVMFQNVDYMEHKCHLFLSIASKASFMIKSTQNRLLSPMTTIRGNRDIEFERIPRFKSDCEKFISMICDEKIHARRLTADDWCGTSETQGIVIDYMSLYDQTGITSQPAYEDSFVTIGNKVVQSYIFSNARHLPGEISNVSAIKKYHTDKSDIYLSLSSKIGLLLDCEHVVNQVIMIPDQALVMAGLDKKQRVTQSGADSVDNEINNNELNEYTRRAYIDALFNVFCHCNVMAWSDIDDAEETSNKINNAITSMGVKAIYNTDNTPELWIAGIPGNASDTPVDDLMQMEARSAVFLMSFDTFDKRMPGGYLTLMDRNRLIPITIDIQQVAKELGLISNVNIFLFGPSGSGKSFTTNTIVRNHYDNGNHIFIIDKGDSYQGICTYLNEITDGKDGIYYSWDPKHPFSFKPFQNFRNWKDEDNNGYQCLISVLECIWTPTGGWRNDNLPILHKIVDQFIELHKDDEKDPTFNDFYDYCGKVIRPLIVPKFDSNNKIMMKDNSEKFFVGYTEITPDRFDVGGFCSAMTPYTYEGKYPLVLNNPEPTDLLNSRFVVFEIDKLEQQDKLLYQICILCILNAFEGKMRSVHGNKMMVLEEAWKVLSKNETAIYMQGLWKTARKFHTQAMMVTQQLSDIVSSEIVKDSILQNSDVQIILDQSQNIENIDETKRLMGLSEKDVTLLLSLGKGVVGKHREIFIKWSSKKVGIYAVIGSPIERWLYESDKELKIPLYELADRIGSIHHAALILTGKETEEEALEKIRKKKEEAAARYQESLVCETV